MGSFVVPNYVVGWGNGSVNKRYSLFGNWTWYNSLSYTDSSNRVHQFNTEGGAFRVGTMPNGNNYFIAYFGTYMAIETINGISSERGSYFDPNSMLNIYYSLYETYPVIVNNAYAGESTTVIKSGVEVVETAKRVLGISGTNHFVWSSQISNSAVFDIPVSSYYPSNQMVLSSENSNMLLIPAGYSELVTNPITYIPINSNLSGPSEAATGDTVEVDVSFPDGYIYQETGVQVYNQNGVIPFNYVDGKITFTMPN